MLHEGDRIDVVARASSRQFGGFESVQLEVIDVSAEGAQLGPYSGSASPASGMPAGIVAGMGAS